VSEKTIRRTCKSYVKTVSDEQGTVEKIVSVFGNVDLVNDRVRLGAFAGTLERWKSSGDPIPVIFSHQWNNLDAHVGVVDDAKELAPGDELLPDELKDLGGLWVREKYDLDQPFAKRLFDLQKQRRIKESSFAYDVIEETKAKDGVNDLIELDLIEVGPTLKGANPDTALLAAKAMPAEMLAAVKDIAAKAQVTLDGSYEQLHEQLDDAVRDWALVNVGGDIYTAGLEASYADYVIIYVELWSEPWGGGTYYRADYTLGADGPELGEPTEVVVTGVTRPKSVPHATSALKTAAAGTKEGRRNSDADQAVLQSVHDQLVTLGASCATVEDDTSVDDSEDGAKALLRLAELELAAL
jgi:HK97 family phage prohead protease